LKNSALNILKFGLAYNLDYKQKYSELSINNLEAMKNESINSFNELVENEVEEIETTNNTG